MSKRSFVAIATPLALVGAFILFQGSASKDLKHKEPPPPVEQAAVHEHRSMELELVPHDHRYQLPDMPDSLEFCGEPVPLHDRNVYERLERELIVNCYYHSSTFLVLKRTGRYFTQIEQILEEEGVPEDFKYLAMAESGLQNATSGAGAKGVWQFIRSTGRREGLEITSGIDERYHLEKATRAACNYLKKAKSEFGNWTTAAASYNRGEAGMRNALDDQHQSNYYDLFLNPETYRYVFRILAMKLIEQDPDKYGFELDEKSLYKPFSTYDVRVNTSIKDLPEYAKKKGTSYKILRELNPWIHGYSLENRSGKSYVIELPFLEAERADEGE